MPISFVVDQESKNTFAGRTLLLDTNALLDAYRLPAEFYDLVKELFELDCDLVTTKSIALEFLGGTTDKANIEKKKEFLETLFGKQLGKTYMPLDHSEPNLDDLLAFCRQANKFSIPDYELYCTLKKYGDKIALVTRNHKDFTTNLVTRISFITLLGKAEIHTYGVYSS
jgi:predicted nucleic acid-binding protein